jgi:hypothetical protein
MDTSAATQVTELALQVIAPIVIALGAWIAHRLVRLLEEKTGIDIPDKQEAKIDHWIEQGIALAAEKSHQKLKAHTEKLKGPEKLEEAADYVFALAASRGWTNWTKSKIKDKIEASLGAHRDDS